MRWAQNNQLPECAFVAEAGHIYRSLGEDVLIENEYIEHILFAKPKKNMKSIVTAFQKFLYVASFEDR